MRKVRECEEIWEVINEKIKECEVRSIFFNFKRRSKRNEEF